VSFWRTALQFRKEKIAPWIALRNTLGFALVLAGGFALGFVPAALIASIGALNVSYSDSHDPYLLRARRMLAACALVGLAVFAGAVCGNYHLLAVPVAGAWAFAAGMLVALSSTAADLGIMSLVTLVVFAAKPLPPESAVLSGLLALGGGLLETALALAFWPMRKYAPERRVLAAFYTELARTAATPLDVRQPPPASAQSTQAQAALASLGIDHSIDGERYRMLLSQAERTRLGLFELARLRARIARDAAPGAGTALLDRYLELASRVLQSIGDALLAAQPDECGHSQLESLQALAEELRTRPPEPASAAAGMLQDVRRQMDAVTGQLRSARDLASSATVAGLTAFARQEVRLPWHLRLAGTLATLRANLSLRSAACRHAVRLAVCVAIGVAVGRGFELQRSYWLPMTVAIVLKPDFASTFSRGALRLGGTFAGLAFATALFRLLPAAPPAQIAAIVALMFILRCWGPANYGILVTAVTGMIVLLIALAGVSPKEVVAARGLNTAIGGAIALAAYWLWPTWESTRVQDEMAQMLDAYRAYFHVIRESYIQPEVSFEDGLDQARQAARRARSNLEASFDRLRGEPRTTAQTIAAVSGALASSHRLIHSIMALEAGVHGSGNVPAREAFRRFANDVEITLHSLAGALRGSPLRPSDLPDLREDHHALVHSGDPAAERYALVNVETDRVTNSLNTLRDELLKWLDSGAVLFGVSPALPIQRGQ
jgi:uncharacterized membrane protein YccC